MIDMIIGIITLKIYHGTLLPDGMELDGKNKVRIKKKVCRPEAAHFFLLPPQPFIPILYSRVNIY